MKMDMNWFLTVISIFRRLLYIPDDMTLMPVASLPLHKSCHGLQPVHDDISDHDHYSQRY